MSAKRSKKEYRKRSKRGDGLREVVDEVVQEHSRLEPEIYFCTPIAENFTNEERVKDGQKIMRAETVVMNEINAESWTCAFKTCLGDITPTTVPHFAVLQRCICNILNSEFIDMGLIKTFLSKLVFFHPPNTAAMECYYWHILYDAYLVLDDGYEESENILWVTVESLISCLENPDTFKGLKNVKLGIDDNLKPAMNEKPIFSVSSIIYFKNLPPCKQFERVFLIFEFLCDVLEWDFAHRLRTNTVHSDKTRCFLSRLLWWQVYDIGGITSAVKKLTNLIQLMEDTTAYHIGQVHRRLTVMLAEFFRIIDIDKDFNPFVPNKKYFFVSELSIKLFESLKKNYKPEGLKALRMVRPHWLRLEIISKWLGYITCKLCTPELSSVHNVLNDLMNLITKRRMYRGSYDHKTRKRRKWDPKSDDRVCFNLKMRYCYIDCVFRVHRASERMRHLQRDINERDGYGWGPLHRAALLGHERCVENILNLPTEVGPFVEGVNPRLWGYKNFTPLMCALLKEEGKICRLLLEHSGHASLDDISMRGDSPFDLREDKDIGRFIKSFGGTSSCTEGWQKFYFTHDDIPLVVALCVMFVESYFVTHRTRDVIARAKSYKSGVDDLNLGKSEEAKKLFYDRYEKDITVNVKNISEILNKFPEGTEIRKSLEPLNVLLNHGIDL